MARGADITPRRDLNAYLTRYPQEIALGDEEPDAVFDRYHTADFVLYNDGLPLDRDKLLAHIRPARKNAASIHIDVHQTVTSGDQVAAHYTLTAVMRRGHTVTTDIYMFGYLAVDGRLRRVDQLTRDLSTDHGAQR
jgi:hypothetical protein